MEVLCPLPWNWNSPIGTSFLLPRAKLTPSSNLISPWSSLKWLYREVSSTIYPCLHLLESSKLSFHPTQIAHMCYRWLDNYKDGFLSAELSLILSTGVESQKLQVERLMIFTCRASKAQRETQKKAWFSPPFFFPHSLQWFPPTSLHRKYSPFVHFLQAY